MISESLLSDMSSFVMEETSPYARPLKHMNAVQRGVAQEELYGDSAFDDNVSTHKASDRVQDQNLSVKQLYHRYFGMFSYDQKES